MDQSCRVSACCLQQLVSQSAQVKLYHHYSPQRQIYSLLHEAFSPAFFLKSLTFDFQNSSKKTVTRIK